MAEAIADVWKGLSDLQKVLSVIGTFASSIVAAVLAFTLAWSQFSGYPERMDTVEEIAAQNTAAVKLMELQLNEIRAGQILQTCLLLADANGTPPLECL